MIRLWRRLMGLCVECGRPSQPYRALYCGPDCAWTAFDRAVNIMEGRRDLYRVQYGRAQYRKQYKGLFK